MIETRDLPTKNVMLLLLITGTQKVHVMFSVLCRSKTLLPNLFYSPLRHVASTKPSGECHPRRIAKKFYSSPGTYYC